MKKLLAVGLILALALCGVASAEKEAWGKWGNQTVFTVSYDEKRFQMDTEELKSENTLTSQYQFTLYDGFCFLTCFIDYYDWMSGFSSYLASEEDMKLYIEDTLGAYEGVEIEAVEVYPVTVSRGQKTATLPFLILRAAEGEDVLYQAELMSHGYSILFNCGFEGAAGREEKLLSTLKAVLDTFQPVSE